MTETTENMAPCDACRWYYNNQAAKRGMEWRYEWHPDHVSWTEADPNGSFHADRIYRLKQPEKRVLITGKLACDSPPFPDIPCIEDPGPEAVILSRMPTELEASRVLAGWTDLAVRQAGLFKLLQSLTLEVKRD